MIIYILIIFLIFLFYLYYNYSKSNLQIAHEYHNKYDGINAIQYYNKCLQEDNIYVLINIATIYHYGIHNSIDINLFKAFQNYYLLLHLLKDKNDISSRKYKYFAYNKINQIYNNNNNFMIQNYNENKVNALKILLNLINNKNDDEVNILFNKYINKYKFTSIEYYHYGGIIIFDTIESFLLILEQYNISNFFKELSNNLLKTKEQIEIDSVKIESVKKESVKKESVKK